MHCNDTPPPVPDPPGVGGGWGTRGGNIATRDAPATTADYLASATLVALLKKNEEGIHALRELFGPDFVLPICSLAMACVFCEAGMQLSRIKDDIADVTDPCQFAVRCKGDANPYNWPYMLRWRWISRSPMRSWMPLTGSMSLSVKR